MALTFSAAAWFLPFVLPLCLFIAFSDLSRMKIPTWSTDLLLVIFILVGLIALPFSDWAWRLLHFPVLLALGIILNAAGAMGAGDAKFIASAAPFFAREDLHIVLPLSAACLLGGFAAHRLAKHSALRSIAPHWASWEQERNRFPMGLPLIGILLFYLAFALYSGAIA